MSIGPFESAIILTVVLFFVKELYIKKMNQTDPKLNIANKAFAIVSISALLIGYILYVKSDNFVPLQPDCSNYSTTPHLCP